MNLNNEFVCKECNLFFESPICLPCGDTICQKHIESDIYNCFICKKEHPRPEYGFPLNNVVLKLMRQGSHLNETKRMVVNSLNELKLVLKKHDSIKPNEIITDYYRNLKDKVELHQQELIDQIKTKSDSLKKKLDEMEYECKSNQHYKINKLNSENQLDMKIFLWENQLRLPNISEKKIDNLFDEINELSLKIENERSKILNERLIHFKPSDDLSFGDFSITMHSGEESKIWLILKSILIMLVLIWTFDIINDQITINS